MYLDDVLHIPDANFNAVATSLKSRGTKVNEWEKGLRRFTTSAEEQLFYGTKNNESLFTLVQKRESQEDLSLWKTGDYRHPDDSRKDNAFTLQDERTIGKPIPELGDLENGKSANTNTINLHNEWVVHDGNCHYAKDRSSFLNYTKVIYCIGMCSPSQAGIEVVGKGTVKLKFFCELQSMGICELIFRNVFHIPSAKFNGFSSKRLDMEKRKNQQPEESQLPPMGGETPEPLFYGTKICGLLPYRLSVAYSPSDCPMLEKLDKDNCDGQLQSSIDITVVQPVDMVRAPEP
ncbi:hypothetical protein MMC13_005307 [Lambiella insularis]|nr:hypothetical protein [Lambiella insularis]